MYITSSEYATLTGGTEADATDPRIKRASRLLDARIGNYARGNWKLDLDTLETFQSDAVKQWVAWAVYSLVQNNDSIEVNETIRLGRFSATARQDKSELLPDSLVYADQELKDSGLVKLGVEYTGAPNINTVVNA